MATDIVDWHKRIQSTWDMLICIFKLAKLHITRIIISLTIIYHSRRRLQCHSIAWCFFFLDSSAKLTRQSNLLYFHINSAIADNTMHVVYAALLSPSAFWIQNNRVYIRSGNAILIIASANILSSFASEWLRRDGIYTILANINIVYVLQYKCL